MEGFVFCLEIDTNIMAVTKSSSNMQAFLTSRDMNYLQAFLQSWSAALWNWWHVSSQRQVVLYHS